MILDFASPGDYVIALLPEVLLLVGAFVVLLGDVFQRGSRSGPSAPWTWMATIGFVIVAALANAWLLLEVEAGPGLIVVDGFRVAANFILLGCAGLAVLFGLDYQRREGLDIGEYYALLLLATIGMMVLVGTQDLLLVFLGLELMSIAVYVLTGFNRRDPRSAEAGLKYFLVGAFASAFLLYGLAFIYGATGSTNVATAVAGLEAGDLLLGAGALLLLIGFAFKIAAVPFHMWTPDAYEGAPTPVTAFMATGVKTAAFIALIRIFAVELAPAADVWESAVWWLAMLSMIVPNLIALVQNNIKRMLAYSSIAHAGYLLVGVAAGSPAGRAAALFYLAVYALMTLGVFSVVYLVAGKGDTRVHLSDYRGLGWRRPALGAALLIFLLSLAGFPPTGGFVGKLYLLQAAVGSGQISLAITLVLTTLVSYYYYLRVVWKMYFEEGADLPVATSGGAFRTAAAICSIGVLLLGLLPGRAVRGFERAGDDVASGDRPSEGQMVVSPR